MDQVERNSSLRAVNDDMRQARANLALIIRECGLSQSELARRSGLSRQLINGWARQRLPVSLSTTVGRLLSIVKFGLADLLLDEKALCDKLGKPSQYDHDLKLILPNLARFTKTNGAIERLRIAAGTYRFRSRIDQAAAPTLDRIFHLERRAEHGLAVTVFDGPRAGERPFAEGICLYHQSIFFIFVECADAPHDPLLYSFRDPHTPVIKSLHGVAIAPAWYGPDIGLPLSKLVYMRRLNGDKDMAADSEFENFIPADRPSMLTTF